MMILAVACSWHVHLYYLLLRDLSLLLWVNLFASHISRGVQRMSEYVKNSDDAKQQHKFVRRPWKLLYFVEKL